MKKMIMLLILATAIAWMYARMKPAVPSPAQVLGVAATGVVSAGDDHIVAIEQNGDLYGWGNNRSQQLVLGKIDVAPIPKLLKQDAGFRYVTTGFRATYAIATNGKLWRYRVFDDYECARGECSEIYGPVFDPTQWRKVKTSSSFFAGIDTQDAMWLWWEPSKVPRDNPTEPKRAQVLPLNGWKDMCFANDWAYAVASDGTLWKYVGRISEQKLSDASGLALTPVGVQAKFDRVYCRGEALHVMALEADGKLWGFGGNTYGELGDGWSETGAFINDRYIRRIGDKRWMDIGIGDGFTIAIAGDGSLWGWGANSGGQLGIGEERGGGTPKLIDNERQWAMVDAGGGYIVALTRKGELYTWGSNLNGALGIGTGIAERKTPTKVFGSHHWGSDSRNN